MIAIIADIHGNIPALEAVLADTLRFDVDEILCLGDVANAGPEPTAAIARLRAADALTVMGNTDAYLLDPRRAESLPTPPRAEAANHLSLEAWCAEQLSEADREYVRGFAPYRELELGGLRVVAYHGSPRSYDDPIRSATPDEQLAEWLGGHPADLYLGGHAHEQFVKRFRGAVVANPGSVGMAVRLDPDGTGWHPAVAEYALLQVLGGQACLHLRKVPYELDHLREAVRRSGMPEAEWYLERFR